MKGHHRVSGPLLALKCQEMTSWCFTLLSIIGSRPFSISLDVDIQKQYLIVHLSIVMFLQAPIPSIGSLGVFESKMPERNNSREENLDILMVSKVTAATVRKTWLSSSVCSHRNLQWQLLMGQETRIRMLEIEAMSRSSLSLSQKDSTFFKVTSRTDDWVLKRMSVRDIADSDSTWLL